MTTTQNTKTQTASTATDSGSLAYWLTAEGFTFEGQRGEYSAHWFRKGSIRVVIEDEGYVTINVFDPRRPKADILDWDVKLVNAPLDVVTRTIDLARQTVRAAMLPTD